MNSDGKMASICSVNGVTEGIGGMEATSRPSHIVFASYPTPFSHPFPATISCDSFVVTAVPLSSECHSNTGYVGLEGGYIKTES